MSENPSVTTTSEINVPEVKKTRVDSLKVTLSKEQELLILELWNNSPESPLRLQEIVEKVWGVGADVKSKKGRAVRDFLVTRDLKYKTNDYVKKTPFELSEDNKVFIANNIKTMGPLEMAKYIFENDSLTSTSMETRSVMAYISEIPSAQINAAETDTYRPPKTIDQAAFRVNKYILDCISTDARKDTKIQTNLKTLIKFCHQQRFMTLMDNLTLQKDKDLLEGRYVSFVWDKPDLSEEELDLYINLCCDIMDCTHMRDELTKLKEMFQNCADDTEGKRVSMTIVESIKNVRKDIDENLKRQKQYTEILQGKRNERIDTRVKKEASLVQLVDFWKNYENRQQILALAELRKKEVKDEIDRLKNMDDLKAQIFGISPDEILNS